MTSALPPSAAVADDGETLRRGGSGSLTSALPPSAAVTDDRETLRRGGSVSVTGALPPPAAVVAARRARLRDRAAPSDFGRCRRGWRDVAARRIRLLDKRAAPFGRCRGRGRTSERAGADARHCRASHRGCWCAICPTLIRLHHGAQEAERVLWRWVARRSRPLAAGSRMRVVRVGIHVEGAPPPTSPRWWQRHSRPRREARNDPFPRQPCRRRRPGGTRARGGDRRRAEGMRQERGSGASSSPPSFSASPEIYTGLPRRLRRRRGRNHLRLANCLALRILRPGATARRKDDILTYRTITTTTRCTIISTHRTEERL